MSMQASLIAIGPFTNEVVEHLDYPKNFYSVKSGTTTVTSVICCETTSASHDLADALGFDAWDFEKHCFFGNEEQVVRLGESGFDTRAFEVLMRAGFQFAYMPNG